MQPVERPPQSSKMEIKLQWIGTIFMALGLVTSVYYHARTLHAEHVASEIDSYLHLNDRYHKLLFTLLQNDPGAFEKTDPDSMHKNKYLMYDLFELFATVDLLKNHFHEVNKETHPSWQRRIEFVFAKPAIQHAWQSHLKDAKQIYNPDFVASVEKVITDASAPISENLQDM